MNNTGKESLELGFVNQIDWNKVRDITDQVIPAVVTLPNGEVLGIFYLDRDSFLKSCNTRMLSLYSTSRKKPWTKGEESGNTFSVISISINCEQNSLLIVVGQDKDGICHVKDTEGKPHQSCFYREINLNNPDELFFHD